MKASWKVLSIITVIALVFSLGFLSGQREKVMVTLDDIKRAVDNLEDTIRGAIASGKITPKQIVTVQGLSDINNSLGTIRAGDFLAMSSGTEPTAADGTGSFMSALGRMFGSKTYHIGGVKDGDLKWGANALTGELEAGDGAVNLTANGISLYDGTTEIGRFGNLNGFLGYSTDVYGMAMGDSDQYMTYDQTNGLQVYGAVVSDREILTEDRTYYVATTGSDSNSGLTVGAPFLTIQHAIDVITNSLDIRGYDVTIQLADGTYTVTTSILLGTALGSGDITIQGNSITPTNVIVNLNSSTVGSATFRATNARTVYHLKDFKITSGRSGIKASYDSYITISGVDFGACTAIHMIAEWGGVIEIIGNYTISGSAGYHFDAVEHGRIINNTLPASPYTVTVSGTPTFDTFANAGLLGIVYVPYITWSGSATGSRYASAHNAIIGTGSAGANYFPGNSAGSTATGGIYD